MSNCLAETRRSKGITQAQLARGLGITRYYLSKIENNKHEAAAWIAIKAAGLLGVPVEEIFYDDETELR